MSDTTQTIPEPEFKAGNTIEVIDEKSHHFASIGEVITTATSCNCAWVSVRLAGHVEAVWFHSHQLRRIKA